MNFTKRNRPKQNNNFCGLLDCRDRGGNDQLTVTRKTFILNAGIYTQQKPCYIKQNPLSLYF